MVHYVVVAPPLLLLVVALVVAVLKVVNANPPQRPAARVKPNVYVPMAVVLAVLHLAQPRAVQHLGRVGAANRVKVAILLVGYVGLLLAVNLVVAVRWRVAQLKE